MDPVDAASVSPSGLTPHRLGKPNLKDSVADTVRELIYSGRLRSGARIDQKELALALGVSKLPVREALITLEGEGLIENIPRHGAFVAALSRSDVRDHYMVFGLVAGLAGEAAAAAIDQPGLMTLETILAEMGATQDAGELERLNLRFHQVINRAGSSRRLRVSLKHLAKSLPPRFYANPGWAEIAYEDHQAILNGLRAGDGAAVRHSMEEHLRKCADVTVAALDALSFWGEDHPLK